MQSGLIEQPEGQPMRVRVLSAHTKPRLAGTFTILALIVAASAGVIGGVVLTPDRAPDPLRPAAAITSAPVLEQTFEDERTIPIALAVSEDTPLFANTEGKVTAVHASAGTPIASGSSPVSIDGVPVLALSTSVPLYRDLANGNSGPDVLALQDELRRLGYEVDSTGNYGSATSAAVRDLKLAAGMSDPDGRLPLAVTLWLPAETVTPGEWTALLDTRVTTGGSYGSLPGQLTALTATTPDTLAPGVRTLTLWGTETVLPENGQVNDAGFLSALSATPDYAVVLASGEQESLTATIRLETPVQALKVPPTALFDIEGTSACIQADGAALPVSVVGSGLGASLVTIDTPGIPTPTAVAIGEFITATECL
jgi:peptidoglycan hydrolase-like protein with peptidoglycan-binding domain